MGWVQIFLGVFWKTLGAIAALWVVVIFGYLLAYAWRGILKWGRQKNCEHHNRLILLGDDDKRHRFQDGIPVQGKLIEIRETGFGDNAIVVRTGIFVVVNGDYSFVCKTGRVFLWDRLYPNYNSWNYVIRKNVSRETKVEGGE